MSASGSENVLNSMGSQRTGASSKIIVCVRSKWSAKQFYKKDRDGSFRCLALSNRNPAVVFCARQKEFETNPDFFPGQVLNYFGRNLFRFQFRALTIYRC